MGFTGGAVILRNQTPIIACILVAALIGCGGGNRMFSQRGGEVVSGELVLDSIPAPPEGGEYIIGYGDKLDIDFLFNPDYSRSNISVRPDGRITFPYIGEIEVAGMTPTQLDTLITEKYSELFVDPNVTVMVSSFQEPLVYVFGKVRSPGGYPVDRGQTLLTALSLASGIYDEAKKNGVLVIRRVAPDRVVGIQVDLTQLLDEHRFDLDIPLKPNDIVYVPQSLIDRTEEFVGALATIIGKPMELYMKGWQVWHAKVYYDFWKQQIIPP